MTQQASGAAAGPISSDSPTNVSTQGNAAPQIEGYIEDITPQKVSGWGWRTGDPAPLHLEILVAGRLQGVAEAARFRPDLLASGKGDGNHAFEFIFTDSLDSYHRDGMVQVRVRGADRLLVPTDDLTSRLAAARDAAAPPPHPSGAEPPRDAEAQTPPVTEASPPATQFAPPPSALPHAAPRIVRLAPRAVPAPLPPAGQVLSLTLRAGQLAGMAILPGEAPSVLVMIDGVSIGEATLAPEAAGGHGQEMRQGHFSLPVPPALLDAQEHRVAVFDAATRRRLDGGTHTLRLSPGSSDDATPKPAARQTRAPAPQTQSAPALPSIWIIASAAAVAGARVRFLAILCQIATGIPPRIATLGGSGPNALPDGDIAALANAARILAAGASAHAILVATQEFSALLAGSLLRAHLGAPLLADISLADLPPAPDDTQDAAILLGQTNPAAASWSAFAADLLAEADGVILPTATLRPRTGGIVVRQGLLPPPPQDDPAPPVPDRATLREALAYAEDDRVLLVDPAHTPPDQIAMLAAAIAASGARIKLHEATADRPFAANLAIADAYWAGPAGDTIPPAIAAALAANVVVLAPPAPALTDLGSLGALRLIADPPALDAALRDLAALPPSGRIRQSPRHAYLAEFSPEVGAARLALAITAAAAAPLPHPHTYALFRRLRRTLGLRLPIPAPIPTPGAPPPSSAPQDLVIFTAGNDSDLFNLRTDLLVQHSLAEGKIRRVLHFDAPLRADALEALPAGADGDARRGSLVYANTVRRVLGLADTPNCTRRTFVYRRGKRAEHAMGRDLPPHTAYADFIRQSLAEAGIDSPPIVWVCAGAPDLPAIRAALPASMLVADAAEAQLGPARAPLPADIAALIDAAAIVICDTQAAAARLAPIRRDAEIIPHTDADGMNALWRRLAEETGHPPP